MDREKPWKECWPREFWVPVPGAWFRMGWGGALIEHTISALQIPHLIERGTPRGGQERGLSMWELGRSSTCSSDADCSGLQPPFSHPFSVLSPLPCHASETQMWLVSSLLERDLVVSPHHVQRTRSKPLHTVYKSSHGLSNSPHFTSHPPPSQTAEVVWIPQTSSCPCIISYDTAFARKSLQRPLPLLFYFLRVCSRISPRSFPWL